MNMELSSGDEKFLRKAMREFGIRHVRVEYSTSKAAWPDIEVKMGKVPLITVTDEWKRQKVDERRKRLLHEILHIKGMKHGKKGKYTYHTIPAKDTYSEHVYQNLKNKFRRKS